MTGDDVRLKSPLPCWHESVASARTDPLVTLSVHGGHIETPRPVPPGTPLFLELSLGQSLGAEKAEIDAVAEAPAPGRSAGFTVRFLRMDERARSWIEDRVRAEEPPPPVVEIPSAPAAVAVAPAASPAALSDAIFDDEPPPFVTPPLTPAPIAELEAAFSPAPFTAPPAFRSFPTRDATPSAFNALSREAAPTRSLRGVSASDVESVDIENTQRWAIPPKPAPAPTAPASAQPRSAVGNVAADSADSVDSVDSTQPWARASGDSMPPRPIPAPHEAPLTLEDLDHTRPWARAEIAAPTPAPRALTPPPRALTPAPRALTPLPRVMTPAPRAMTPAPRVMTPAPRALTPIPASPVAPRVPPLGAILPGASELAMPMPRMASLDVPGGIPAAQSFNETMRWPTAQLRVAQAPLEMPVSAQPAAPPPDLDETHGDLGAADNGLGALFGASGGFLGDDDDLPTGGNPASQFGFEVTDPGQPFQPRSGDDDDDDRPVAATVEDQPFDDDEPAAATEADAPSDPGEPDDVLEELDPVDGPLDEEPASVALMHAELDEYRDVFGSPVPPPADVAAPVRQTPPPLPLSRPRATLPFGVPAFPMTTPPSTPRPFSSAERAPTRTTDPLFPAVSLSPLSAEPPVPPAPPTAAPPTAPQPTAAPPIPTTTGPRTLLFAAADVHAAVEVARSPAIADGSLLKNPSAAIPDAVAAQLPDDDAFELAFEMAEPPPRAAAHEPGAWEVQGGPVAAEDPDDLPLIVGEDLPVVVGAPQAASFESWVVPDPNKPDGT